MDLKTIGHNFKHHPPKDDTDIADHEAVRETLKRAMEDLWSILPECRETSLVFTKLEEAMFWGNAALARQRND